MRPAILALMLLFASAHALAEEDRGPGPTPLERLRQDFQKDYLSIGALLRVGASFQRGTGPRGTPADGFAVDAARLRLSGNLDRNVSYLLESDAIEQPTLLDTRLTWRFFWGTSLTVGQFKTPMSREQMTSLGAIDLREPAQAVSAIAPGRDRGAMIEWTTTDGRLIWSAGAWNGTGKNQANDDDRFLYLGRLVTILYEGTRPWGLRRLEVGASGGVSRDKAVDLSRLDGGGFSLNTFEGRRELYGAEGLVRLGEIEISGEYLQALLDPAGYGAPDLRAEGWYCQAKAFLSKSWPRPEAIIRQDVLRPNRWADRREVWALGVNTYPSESTRMQVVGAIGGEDATDLSLSAGFQVAF